MRKLSKNFMDALTSGFLSRLTQRVVQDKDLDLEIRDNYLNIYFKGNSLLRLAEKSPGDYQVTIHRKFLRGCSVPERLTDEASVTQFLDAVPFLKKNIIQDGQSSLEVEYEQMIIRANNYERRSASEYFIIDRQYVAGQSGRFDLTGFYWNRNRRRKYQTVPLCLMEIKFALNADIQNVDQQLQRYYEAVKQDAQSLAAEAESMLRQKLELGLFDQPKNRLEAMKTLKISRDIEEFQFILFLIDYNPFSHLLDEAKLAVLPFANQLRIFRGGFALWNENLSSPQKQTQVN
jgi:hypothetical protein